MKNLISLDQVLQNIKAQNEESRLTIEAAEKTIKIINKIVESREALGLTQRDLAKKCGIQQPALARIETCKVIPKLNTIIKIAEAVGVKIESFTPIEEKQMKMIYSFSQVVINSSLYNSSIGGYYGYKN
jgi:DNA-binding XRE family transcriptional regulator